MIELLDHLLFLRMIELDGYEGIYVKLRLRSRKQRILGSIAQALFQIVETLWLKQRNLVTLIL